MPFPTIPLLNPKGLWAFLLLVPFILIYLRRPKPVEKVVPSLMFIMKEHNISRQHSFLRTLLRNLLFFLQLLVLCALAFSAAQPYIELPRNLTSQATAIVIDGSASMQAGFEGISRFERAVELAKGSLGGKNSIILASNIPRIALEGGSRKEALEVLKALKPADTTTNIGDAIISAGHILKDRGEIIVISDFIATQGMDPLVARRKVASSGIAVRFVSVWSLVGNAGFTGARIGKDETKAYVRNFDSTYKSVSVVLYQGAAALKKFGLRIAPKSTEQLAFETPRGVSRLEIAEEDGFPVDNVLYICTPPEKEIAALLLTNRLSSNLQTALESSGSIALEVIEPPSIIPAKKYDIIITGNLDTRNILPGTFDEIGARVKNGTALVVTAHEQLMQYMPERLLPVRALGSGNLAEPVVKIFNQFTNNIEFKPAEKHIVMGSRTNETLTIVATNGSRPLIALAPHGNGTVVYYGIFDDYSDFRNSPSYPIFWDSLVTTLVPKGEISNYNKLLDEMPAMLETGVFEKDGAKIALNLLNDAESDVSREVAGFLEENSRLMQENVEQKKRIDIEAWLIIAAALLLIAELFIVKSRGDA